MALVASNASILKVTGKARAADPGSDREGQPGPTKFEGSARAYLVRKRQRRRVSGDDVFSRRRYLVVDTRDPIVDWQPGDVVTFARDATLTSETGTISGEGGLELERLAGSGVETIRLELEEE